MSGPAGTWISRPVRPIVMKRLSLPDTRRPGLRAGVLSVSAGLVVVAAFLVSANVSDHLAATATAEAVRTTAAVVHAYVDPLVARGDQRLCQRR